MAISPDGKILINTSETTNMAHFIDTATRQIVANVLVDSRPRFAEFKRDGSELWVSSEIGGTVSIIDPAKHVGDRQDHFRAFRACGSEAIQPVGIGMTKDGKTAFVALGPANRIAVVDGTSHAVTKYLLVGQRVWHMAFTPDEKYLLVTNGVSNDVSVIDVAAQKVIKTIQVGELPWGITMHSHDAIDAPPPSHQTPPDIAAGRDRGCDAGVVDRRRQPFLWRAARADRHQLRGRAGELHRAARPQRRRQEHAVLAGHAAVRHPDRAHRHFRP